MLVIFILMFWSNLFKIKDVSYCALFGQFAKVALKSFKLCLFHFFIIETEIVALFFTNILTSRILEV